MAYSRNYYAVRGADRALSLSHEPGTAYTVSTPHHDASRASVLPAVVADCSRRAMLPTATAAPSTPSAQPAARGQGPVTVRRSQFTRRISAACAAERCWAGCHVRARGRSAS